MIYLDNNASTPVDPEVSDAVFSCLKRDFGNPSSSHMPGKRAREVIETSRTAIAEFLRCSEKEIYFTSGGTESNNLALLGTALLHQSGHIITSCIEHPSVLNAVRHLESRGFEVTYIGTDHTGIANLDEVSKAVRKNTILISIMHANNETGVLQPIEDIGTLARKHGIPFHVDAAQSIGKMFFTLKDSLVDMLTIVPHKFYGPKGVGALYLRSGRRLAPLMFGADHEMHLRPGTENVPGIAGFAKAAQIAVRDLDLRVSHTVHLRDSFFRKLQNGIPDIMLNGDHAMRLPNTLNICIPGISSHDLVNRLCDTVAISSGSACHSGRQTPSRVLQSMGLSDEHALSSIRVSIGKDNTAAEIDEAAKIIVAAVQEMKKSAPVQPSSCTL